MAADNTLVKQGVMGDLAYEIWEWDANSTSPFEIATSLKTLHAATLTVATASARNPMIVYDTDASGSTAVGKIQVTPVNNSDTGVAIVWGESY